MGEARRAFRDGGYEGAIRTHDWNRAGGALANLMDYKGNRQAAAEVAEQIVAYRREHLWCPIDLVGYSGGAGMALMVAEALPEDIRLRNIILVQGAVSPDYDLSQVMDRVEGKIVNFYSPYDWLLLGVGTWFWGTMDRAHVVSAGNKGFDADRAVPDEIQRAKLEQYRWSGKMLASGHLGGHFSILFYQWNKEYVVPYLTGDSRFLGETREKP